MREIAEVQVEHAILHQIEPGDTGLLLSARDIPLDASATFGKFLADHISNALGDSQTRAAKFPDGLGPGSVSATCQELLQDNSGLVQASQHLARALHAAIGSDQRISPGALVIALYHDAAAQPPAEQFVAMIKLDPSGVFRPEWRTDDQGVGYLDVRTFSGVLPTVRERLQKCAFVRTFRPTDRYGLLVLDRQVPGVSARFFLTDFLAAELAFDDTALTQGLYRAVVTARNSLENKLPTDRLNNLDDSIRGLFSAAAVNLDDWLPTLPEDERTAIEQEVETQQLDRSFTFDPEIHAQLNRKVRYKGDYGLELRVDGDAYSRMVTVAELPGQTPRRFRVVIETGRWELR
jgi:nucleoid-associated protein YejK